MTSAEKQRLPIALHLSADLNPASFEDVASVLRRYGKCTSGRYFTRDIVIPGDMPLYALHYTIQKLYGFSDSHPMRFYLPEKRFRNLTGGIGRMLEYCGVFLRHPDQSDAPDPFFDCDDDFEEGSSDIRQWLKSQYTGPYRREPGSESYERQQEKAERSERKLEEEYQSHPLSKHLTSDRFLDFLFSYEYNDLLTRLPVAQVLAPTGTKLLSADEWRAHFDKREPAEFEYLTNKLLYEYDPGDSWKVEITRPSRLRFPDSVFRQVVETQCPICIASDGFYLVDDVGGIDGYADFIRIVFGGRPSEDSVFESTADAYEWAHDTFGWTKKEVKPEKML